MGLLRHIPFKPSPLAAKRERWIKFPDLFLQTSARNITFQAVLSKRNPQLLMITQYFHKLRLNSQLLSLKRHKNPKKIQQLLIFTMVLLLAAIEKGRLILLGFFF